MEKKTKVKKPENITVKAAFLQSACMLPGGRTESTITKEKIANLIGMQWVRGEGLMIRIQTQDGPVEGFVPDTNVKIFHI